MANERVVIHVEIDSDVASGVAKVNAQLAAMGAGADKLRARLEKLDNELQNKVKDTDKLDKSLNKTSDSMEDMTKSSDRLGGSIHRNRRRFRRFTSALGGFVKRINKIAFVTLASEIGLVSLALASVTATLAIGRWSVAAYQAALRGLGVTAAGTVSILGAVAASVRQYQLATLNPYASSEAGLRSVVQSIYNAPNLGVFGMEGLNASIDTLVRGGLDVQSNDFRGILQGLGDFADGDGEKLSSLAAIYAQVRSEGQLTGETMSSLADINPVFARAVGEIANGGFSDSINLSELGMKAAEAGAISARQFEQVFSGQLQSTDAFEGQLDRMGATVVGTLKNRFLELVNTFSEIGRPLLEPLRVAIEDIGDIIDRSLFLIRNAVDAFGRSELIPGMVSGLERFTNWAVRLINDSVPKIDGFVGRMESMWLRVRQFFTGIRKALDPLQEAGRTVIATFGPVFGALFGGFGKLTQALGGFFEENRGEMVDFGQRLARIIDAIYDVLTRMGRAFVDNLPKINAFLTILATRIVPAAGELLGVLKDIIVENLGPATMFLETMAGLFSSIAGILHGISRIPLAGTALALLLMPGFLGGGIARGIAGAATRGIGGIAARGAMGAGAARAAAGLGLGVAGAAAGPGLLSRGVTQAGLLPMRASMAFGGGTVAAAQLASGALGGGLGGLTGGLAGGFVGNRMARGGGSRFGSQLGGAASGLAVGAATGALFGPIGAVVGGLAGFATGLWKATKAVDTYTEEQITGGVQGALSATAGYTTAVQGALTPSQLAAASEEMEYMLENSESLAKQLGIVTEEGIANFDNQLHIVANTMESEVVRKTERMNRNMTALGRQFGLSNERIEELAMALGVDLSGSLRQVAADIGAIPDLLTEAGLASVAQEQQGMLFDFLLGDKSTPGQTRLFDEWQASADALTRSFASGGAGSEQVQDFIADALAAQTALNPNLSPIEQADLLQDQIEMWVRNAELAGFDGIGNLFDPYRSDMEKFNLSVLRDSGLGANYSMLDRGLDSALAGTGIDFDLGSRFTRLTGLAASRGPEQVSAVNEALSSPELIKKIEALTEGLDSGRLNSADAASLVGEIETQLDALEVNVDNEVAGQQYNTFYIYEVGDARTTAGEIAAIMKGLNERAAASGAPTTRATVS